MHYDPLPTNSSHSAAGFSVLGDRCLRLFISSRTHQRAGLTPACSGLAALATDARR